MTQLGSEVCPSLSRSPLAEVIIHLEPGRGPSLEWKHRVSQTVGQGRGQDEGLTDRSLPSLGRRGLRNYFFLKTQGVAELQLA